MAGIIGNVLVSQKKVSNLHHGAKKLFTPSTRSSRSIPHRLEAPAQIYHSVGSESLLSRKTASDALPIHPSQSQGPRRLGQHTRVLLFHVVCACREPRAVPTPQKQDWFRDTRERRMGYHSMPPPRAERGALLGSSATSPELHFAQRPNDDNSGEVHFIPFDTAKTDFQRP
jgi:hypothetical protein